MDHAERLIYIQLLLLRSDFVLWVLYLLCHQNAHEEPHVKCGVLYLM